MQFKSSPPDGYRNAVKEIIPRNKDGFDSKKSTHSPRGGVIKKQEVYGKQVTFPKKWVIRLLLFLPLKFESKKKFPIKNFTHLPLREILEKAGSWWCNTTFLLEKRLACNKCFNERSKKKRINSFLSQQWYYLFKCSDTITPFIGKTD